MRKSSVLPLQLVRRGDWVEVKTDFRNMSKNQNDPTLHCSVRLNNFLSEMHSTELALLNFNILCCHSFRPHCMRSGCRTFLVLVHHGCSLSCFMRCCWSSLRCVIIFTFITSLVHYLCLRLHLLHCFVLYGSIPVVLYIITLFLLLFPSDFLSSSFCCCLFLLSFS